MWNILPDFSHEIMPGIGWSLVCKIVVCFEADLVINISHIGDAVVFLSSSIC